MTEIDFSKCPKTEEELRLYERALREGLRELRQEARKITVSQALQILNEEGRR
ncbi:MAG: hypothetical protein H6895_15215 [Defluviimonas sp.]|nr:hypothetical protein [Rhodobiaceae bacterium]MCC0065410.1 hypothetical protein [Defluviimonas sp.]